MFFKNKEAKKEKRNRKIYFNGYPIRAYMPILFFFSVVGAIGVILTSIESPNFWVKVSVIYLSLAFFLWHYSITDDMQHKNLEIAELKQEVKKLGETIESQKNIIALLEKEIETEKKSDDSR